MEDIFEIIMNETNDGKYKYISFEEFVTDRKTKTFFCRNNKSNSILGVVKWHGPWRQYCFFPTASTIFSKGCLADIQNFIVQITSERKMHDQ
jgi:hypothetical protein